jgi:hypothetical protein
LTVSILLQIFSGLALAGWLAIAAIFYYSSRRTTSLVSISADGDAPLPLLSIVVPALNEERTVESAMRSLLALDYPDFEVLAVDDRSTDRTGEILDRIAADSPGLTVVHVTELPKGWLGKNHALHVGSLQATGKWILFTDADVQFSPDSLRRAMRLIQARELDHLVAFPEMDVRGFWESLYVAFFGTMFTIYARPWEASNPKSKAYIGVGAFNLVRTELYRSFGGHAALPMDIADDVKLGKMMKRSGGRQECVTAEGLVRVRWIEGLRGAILGGEKNMFAGVNYNPLIMIRTVIAVSIGSIWPAIGLFAGPPLTQILCAGTLLAMTATVRNSGFLPVSRLYGLAYPLAAVIFLYAMIRSAALAYIRGGIVWRGTIYRLDELRKGLV